MAEKYFYICDKKPGACASWEKFGWKACKSEFCNHTTQLKHAKHKYSGKFYKCEYGGDTYLWEYTELCSEHLYGCPAIFQTSDGRALCLYDYCPLKNPGCGGF